MHPLSEMVSIPGTFVEVLGQGVLLQGDSGCGKSDLALGLIDRGHRLVADDAVDLCINTDGGLVGSYREGFSGFIEIRGLGVMNVVQLFGESAVSKAAKLDVVVSLVEIDVDASNKAWHQLDRLTAQRRDWRLPKQFISVQTPIPEIVMPYSHGRDMPLLIETAVRLHACRRDGGDMSDAFDTQLNSLLARGAA